MACPITYGNETRMSKVAFISLCKIKREEKTKGWSGGAKNYEPAYPQCASCETGALVAAGSDFSRPAEILEWMKAGPVSEQPPREPALFADMIPAMKMVGMIFKKEDGVKTKNDLTTGLPNLEIFKSLPEKLDRLLLSELRPYWKREPGTKGQMGTCVNCGRDKVKIRDGGVCSSCQNACTKKRGADLLDALQMIRGRLMRPESKAKSAACRALRRTSKKRCAGSPVMENNLEEDFPPGWTKVVPHLDNEIILISPLADLGAKYIRLGEMMQNMRTSIGDLAGAAHELGLSIDIRLEKKAGKQNEVMK